MFGRYQPSPKTPRLWAPTTQRSTVGRHRCPPGLVVEKCV
jgi:hypothetical protein